MNRREFLLTTLALPAAVRGIQAANMPPRIVFFGMTVFRRHDSGLEAIMPTERGHTPLMVFAPAPLKALGLDPQPGLSDKLKRAHPTLESFDYGALIGAANFEAGRTDDPARMETGLKDRLPNLVEAADKAGGRGHVLSVGKGFPSIRLFGGRLREATEESTSPGTKHMWRIKLGAQVVIDSIRVTDISVFQATADEILLRRQGHAGNVTLKRNDMLWILNFPERHGSRTPNITTEEIEHGADWFRLVGFKGSVSMTRVSRGKPDSAATDAAQDTRPAAPEGWDGFLRPLDLPPDSDPCFQARV
jgi:hypothetical protein